MDKELKEMNSSEIQSWKLFIGKRRLQNSNIAFWLKKSMCIYMHRKMPVRYNSGTLWREKKRVCVYVACLYFLTFYNAQVVFL